MAESSNRRNDAKDDTDIDVSGVPAPLMSEYKALMQGPKPLLVSAEQVKFGEEDRDFLFWELRRVLIKKLNPDLDEELSFVEQLMRYDSRDLRIWAHRRWVAEKIGSNAAKEELEFTKKIIHKDANNSFAWSHRQWCFLALGGDWDFELTFCAEILGQDIFSSCAWDQRYFVVSRSPTLGGLEAMRDREVDYALQAIDLEPSNKRPWTFLRLLYKGDLQSMIKNRDLEYTCVSIFKKEREKNEVELSNAAIIDDLLDERGWVNALEMVFDLQRFGYKPSKQMTGAVRALFLCDSGYLSKARSILQKLISGQARSQKFQKCN